MKTLSKFIAATALSIAAMSGTSANAATLLVSYSPITDTNGAFSFNVDSNPTPTVVYSNGFETDITNGTGVYASASTITFYDLLSGGLFDDYYGLQAYSGPTSAPTILTGTYAALRGKNSLQAGIVTISAAAGAVPETATWAMMILGMGAVGYSLRHAKRRSDVKFDAKIKRMTASAIA